MITPQHKPALTGRVWNAPRLNRIGTIADVTANGTVNNQTPGNAKS